MADIVQFHARQPRLAQSFTGRLIAEAPLAAEKLDAERSRMPWFAPLVWLGLSAMCWGFFVLVAEALR